MAEWSVLLVEETRVPRPEASQFVHAKLHKYTSPWMGINLIT